jgi:hypothetical protein
MCLRVVDSAWCGVIDAAGSARQPTRLMIDAVKESSRCHNCLRPI